MYQYILVSIIALVCICDACYSRYLLKNVRRINKEKEDEMNKLLKKNYFSK